MSTELPHGYDVEYGPTPPGAKYEHTDIDVTIGYKFAVWLFVAMIISFGIVYGTFWMFEGREKAANQAAQLYPLAVGQVKEPPAPNLQKPIHPGEFLIQQPRKGSYTFAANLAAGFAGYHTAVLYKKYQP